ncbi:hypothetical protein ACFFSW_35115 [Saccharothrix longispora]|uniref:Secreted protein n=1 Tax=Saccharothrix longispora TaxID=33920 RepID=A0ABU1PRX9_9PSEU|nr:hypothetical protein [Saccharothrix longispora]MDR6593400.1 hypothetical protein [Saccharothrix longispora]
MEVDTTVSPAVTVPVVVTMWVASRVATVELPEMVLVWPVFQVVVRVVGNPVSRSRQDRPGELTSTVREPEVRPGTPAETQVYRAEEVTTTVCGVAVNGGV